ncbi:hypothetical protein IKA15_05640, partial [bacterium]|nr:hypothetical protein [bacterium]
MPHFNLEQLFWFLALFSTIVFILKTVVFLIVGGDCEVEADFDSFSETDSSFSFLSVQTILAFFMGFGWMGLVLLRQVALKMWLTLAIAFVIGVVFMFATAYLMFLVRKLDKKVVVKIEDYVGTEGKAYTEIKP